ncbi:TPA: hypothetical protein SMM36_004613 [Klebsiella oxytoca]|nr:hypothetical protein [Klebsiella oxytoca]
MISRKELFAEISNEAVTEDGEVVGYFVKNSRMNLLEQMLCGPVTVKPMRPGHITVGGERIGIYMRDEVDEFMAALSAAGIKWEAE